MDQETNKKSIFSNIKKAEENKIFKAHSDYLNSKNENKMDLSIGQFLNQNLSPINMECVIKAEKEIQSENLNKEYPPLGGQPDFNNAIQNLFFPDKQMKVVQEGRIATFQIITGGASLRIIAELIKTLFIKQGKQKKIYTSKPTFGPYFKLFEGIEIDFYPYYNSETKSLDIQALIKFLENLQEESIILLQLSSHNPTGLDLSKDEWNQVLNALKKQRHIAIFDVAYLGYGSGSIEEDLYPIHKAAENYIEMFISYSSSKSFCNYSDCVGALLVILNKKEPLNAIRSNLIVLSRSLFSFNSLYGSRIIMKILMTENLKQLWIKEQKQIFDDINFLRKSFIEEIKENYKDINKKLLNLLECQKGVYIYLDLTDEQTSKLAENYGIYTSSNGRINITGIKVDKIKYLVEALKEIL